MEIPTEKGFNLQSTDYAMPEKVFPIFNDFVLNSFGLLKGHCLKAIVSIISRYVDYGVLLYRSVADPGFSRGGAPTPKIAIIFHIFAENCMKMKEFGPPGGGRPWRPPWIRQCRLSSYSKSMNYFYE